jgi:lactate dehydrogenase-like 2-hydroxyacid dehydrogenase
MKIYAILNRVEFNPKDLTRLEDLGAKVFFNKDIEEVAELFEDLEEKVLLLQWTGLKTNGKAELNSLLKVKNLKAVCLSTTSYSWVDYQGLRNNGIDLCNAPGKSSTSVAEFFYFMTIALLRKLPLYIQNNCDELEGVLGREVNNLEVGVVGMGSIGQVYADICTSNNMNVSYWNRSELDLKYPSKSLEQLFIDSDIVFVSLAGNAESIKLINRTHIDSMKKDACILNCAESKLLDNKYIIHQVESGKLGGFGFESFDQKTTDFKSNIYAAPEIAYYTENALLNESQIMTDTAISYTKGDRINLVK